MILELDLVVLVAASTVKMQQVMMVPITEGMVDHRQQVVHRGVYQMDQPDLHCKAVNLHRVVMPVLRQAEVVLVHLADGAEVVAVAAILVAVAVNPLLVLQKVTAVEEVDLLH